MIVNSKPVWNKLHIKIGIHALRSCFTHDHQAMVCMAAQEKACAHDTDKWSEVEGSMQLYITTCTHALTSCLTHDHKVMVCIAGLEEACAGETHRQVVRGEAFRRQVGFHFLQAWQWNAVHHLQLPWLIPATVVSKTYVKSVTMQLPATHNHIFKRDAMTT